MMQFCVHSPSEFKHQRVQEVKKLKKVAEAFLPTRFGEFTIYAFVDSNITSESGVAVRDGKEHVALVKGNLKDAKRVMVRIHSKCLTGDTFASLRCDCRDQLEAALKLISEHGAGILVYLDQEGRGIGLANKIKAYSLQDKGMDTVQANMHLGFPDDSRHYQIAAEILKELGVVEVCLITNNPRKLDELEKNGITVAERVPLVVEPNKFNERYLETKRKKLNHIMEKREQPIKS